MASPQYQRRHQLTREAWRPHIARGVIECVEPVCVFEQEGGSRLIPPSWAGTDLWHLSHDASTGQTIGPSHRRCNLAENARRNNPKRKKVKRWKL